MNPVKLQNILLQTTEKETTPISTEEVKQEYSNDLIIADVIDWVKNNKKPGKLNPNSCHKETLHYWKNFDLLTFTKGILYIERINPCTKKVNKVIVLPHTLIQRALYMFHNTLANCHPGADNSYENCSKKFYFYRMRNEFDLWVKACIVCNKTKQTRAFKRAPLRPIIYNHFNQAISIDLLEPSKIPTPRRNVALLGITDMFTGYLVCVPVKSTSTEETIRNIIEHWFCRFGICSTIHHDLGTNFTSKLFKAVLKVFQIKDKPGTSFHSQTQGKIESQNRRLNMCFRACLSDKDFKNYDLYAKYITFVLNSLKSVRTGYSAYYLLHGHEPTMPRDMFIMDNRLEKLQQDEVTTSESTAYELYRQIRDITRRVIVKTKQRAQYMATQYDKKVKGPFFEKGQYCLVLVNVPKHKFGEKWQGPFLITHKINDWNYIVKINDKEKIINIQKMKPYEVNKYSTLPRSKAPDDTLKSQHPTDTKTEPLNHDSESSSEDEITFTFSSGDENISATADSAPISATADFAPISATADSAPVSATADSTPVSAGVSADDTQVSTGPLQSAGTHTDQDREAHEPLNPVSSDSDVMSQDEEDDQEAFFDASSSLDQQNVDDSATARDVTLSDIDRHGKKRGIKIPLPAGELSRSRGQLDLSGRSSAQSSAQGSAQGSAQSNARGSAASTQHRSNDRYSLRPKVTGVKRYGSKLKSPVKALKKKITRSKDAE